MTASLFSFLIFSFAQNMKKKRKRHPAKLALSFSLFAFLSWFLSIFSSTCLNVRFAMRQVVTATCAQPE